jgi:hypothetical protein
VIDDEVRVGARNQGRELFEQFLRLEGDVIGAVTPGRLETDEDPSIRGGRQTVLRDGRPQQVPAEALETGPVPGADLGIGVKVESAKPRMSAPLGRSGG